MIVIVSATMVSAQVDAIGSDDLETLFEDNFQRGVLNLSGKKIGDKGLSVLLRQVFLKDLKKMDLRYNEISPAGAKILANTSTFKNLKTLILKHNFFSDEGTIAFAKSNSFPKLENLQLGWNEVRDAGALALADSQNFPKLKKLDLRGNFMSSETKKVLRSSLSNLKSLRIFQSE